MSSTPTFGEFLITATGLPLEQIMNLYKAGHPWPMWTAYNVQNGRIPRAGQEFILSRCSFGNPEGD